MKTLNELKTQNNTPPPKQATKHTHPLKSKQEPKQKNYQNHLNSSWKDAECCMPAFCSLLGKPFAVPYGTPSFRMLLF